MVFTVPIVSNSRGNAGHIWTPFFAAIPVEAFTKEMCQIAAKVDADARRAGLVIPFEDLLIGATALQLGFGIGTRNLRHFRMIPGLAIKAL
jgi:predicted nucleic acid-binding protein